MKQIPHPIRILLRHLQAAIFALGHLQRTPFVSIMTISVIAISFALPAMLFVLLQNMQSVVGNWQHDTRISLFLAPSTEQERIDQLRREISLRANVTSVNYISPSQGLNELQQQGGFGELVAQLPDNPLPPVLAVYPTSLLTTPDNIRLLLADLSQYPEVEASKLDMQWLLRLAQVIDLAKRVMLALIVLLSMGGLLIVSNTIRLATYNRRHEIEVLKLIGATNQFIRRPFVYNGLFYGLFGAISAWLLIATLQLWLSGSVSKLAQMYHSDFVLAGLSIQHTLILLLFGATLGAVGARFAVNRHATHIP